MSYPSCRAIMPKFLWKHIIEYMSYPAILKIEKIDSSFSDLVDEDVGKSNFLEHRTNAIVVVRCMSRRMDHFWKYASEEYVECDSIHSMLRFIENDNRYDTSISYYKVFIKAGEYLCNNHNYVFNQTPYNIEINGSKSGSTIIKHSGDENEYKPLYTLSFVISKYFSMNHIKLYNVSCRFKKYRIDPCHNLTDDDLIKIYSYSELYIHNCVFATSYADLAIYSTNKSIISNCTFASRLRIYDLDEYRSSKNLKLKANRVGLNIDITCDIRYSTFSSEDNNCVEIYSEIPCTINFNNNIVLRSTNLFHNQSCTMSDCVTIFVSENNHFDTVTSLYNKTCNNIVIDNTNTFINCGEQLMNQIKN